MAFPCPSQGAGFAGWSGKHFPTRRAKSYKYCRHCNCITQPLPGSGSLCRGPAGIAAHGTGPPGPSSPPGSPPHASTPPCANEQNSPGRSTRTLEPGKINSRRLEGAPAALPAVVKALSGGGLRLPPGSEYPDGVFLAPPGFRSWQETQERPCPPGRLAVLLSGFTRKTWRHSQEFLLERSLPRGGRERCPPVLGSLARHGLSPGRHRHGMTCFPRTTQRDG